MFGLEIQRITNKSLNQAAIIVFTRKDATIEFGCQFSVEKSQGAENDWVNWLKRC